jgi:hypothetical protein
MLASRADTGPLLVERPAAWVEGQHGNAVEPALTRIELMSSAPPGCCSRAVTRVVARHIEPAG